MKSGKDRLLTRAAQQGIPVSPEFCNFARKPRRNAARKTACALIALIAVLAITLRAELQPWLQRLASGPLITVFFRSVPMPGGSVDIRRPPRETIPALTQKITASPNDVSLYRMRASEEELALDFKAAEADWRKIAEISKDRAAAWFELADYFHRRLQPRDELATLRTIAQFRDNPNLTASAQPAWSAFERLLSLSTEQRLPAAVDATTYRAWIARYPKEQAAIQRYIGYLLANKQYDVAAAEMDVYARTFPSDLVYLTTVRAVLAEYKGTAADAIRVYDQAFDPLWVSDLDKGYFMLLDREGRLREYSGRVRSTLLEHPTDLNSAARLFHYYTYQNDATAARRVLVELRLAKEARKEAWTSTELLTLAKLFSRAGDANETARFYYALYSLPGASPAETEESLAGIIRLLFGHSAGLRFGAGDLSFYRDIASVDTSPGFLNGILSLVLNKTSPQWAYGQEDQTSVAYFQRARAAELLDLFDKRFPQSDQRSDLHASLIQTYADYGDDNAIITNGRTFLTAFPSAPERNAIAMLVADAYARANKVTEEFAIYDQMLRELAAKSRGVPLGSGEKARSTEYAAVLDRYLARLSALKRPMDALRLYRHEIDRNPNDAGLYERLAAFLEQNNMSQDVEATYRRAIAKFSSTSWYDRLARWYLLKKETAAFDKLSKEVTAIFSGAELEQYITVLGPGSVADPLYRQINLYAHERFPQDLVFVHNLLNVYTHNDTRDDAAWQRLLRQYWFYESDLRNKLFEQLAKEGRLTAELAAVKTAPQTPAGNPAAEQFVAEAEAWLAHFEEAAPQMRTLAGEFPGNDALTTRASMVYRSLAAYDPANTDVAVALDDERYRANPRNADILANIGDIFADRDHFDRARPFWNRMVRIEPGKTEGYLAAATVFWDYYQFNDALRIIRQGRADFNNPSLFSFETGVIYENKREFTRAVEQYVAGAIDGDEQSQQRLLRLATNKDRRETVDKLTADALAKAAADSWERRVVVKLRAQVLAEMERPADIETLLLSELANTQSQAELEIIGTLGNTYSLHKVQTRSLERRITLTGDPVDKMRLRIELVKLYEQTEQGDLAARTMAELYKENPLILGVVRSTVDFYIRSKQPDRAISTLLEAAAHSRADLAKKFTLEAANDSTDAGQFDRARTLLGTLLKDDPYKGEYQAAMAATYSKAGDDAGLRDYQLATIEALKKAPIPATERMERTAALRRTLIPSLTRLKDYAGAVQQYIEVLNRYPEDETLAHEAYTYAAVHNRTAQMLDFYKKTVAEAPRDYRWPILYGRLQTYAEDYPAAIAAYDLAMKARPDRGDVVQARAQLEERLMRFDDAIRSYTRLYELTYHDPQWMIRIAEMQARQSRPEKAVEALKTAIIGAKSETTEADFEIASKLESWNLIPQALPFVEQGAKLAGKDFAKRTDLGVWARVMTRSRHFDAVLDQLLTQGAPYLMNEVPPLIARYYTPEEKAGLEKMLIGRAANVLPLVKSEVYVPIAKGASLPGLEVRWRYEIMMRPENTSAGVDARFVQLQSERTNYEELGKQLEAFAATKHDVYGLFALEQAAGFYLEYGDMNSLNRLLVTLRESSELSGKVLDYYFAMAAANRGDELIDYIKHEATANNYGNAAVQWALASENQPLAMRAIEARGTFLTPVWTNSYTALAGLYFADSSARISAAFASVLDTRPIGERIKTPFNKDQQLQHDPWFYYASRYGEYLDLMKRQNARDYLPAVLEKTPGNPDAYMAMGDYYAGVDNVPEAIVQFDNVLQLDSSRGDAHDRVARMLWKHGRHDEAIARWRKAIAVFIAQQDKGDRVPEPFWGRVIQTFRNIGHAPALAELRPDMEKLLTDYINRNGAYRSSELVSGAFDASLDAKIDPSWLADLASHLADGTTILQELVRRTELTMPQRIQMQRMLIAIRKRLDPNAAVGDDRVYLISMLLGSGDLKGAQLEWQLIPDAEKTHQGAQEVHLRIAAAAGTLPQLIERFRDVESVSAEALLGAARILREEGNKDASLAILDFHYRRELGLGRLDAANFIGLATVLLERNDTAGAMTQLHRMVLVVADPYETLIPAADLLAEYGKNTEAAEFVAQRVHAVPWDASARIRLVAASPSPNRAAVLDSVAADPQVAYYLRVDAARRVAPQTVQALAGTELGLLSGTRIQPETASKPYYVYARLAAAEDMGDSAARLALLRQALNYEPDNASVRLAALRAALDAKRDNLSLLLYLEGIVPEKDRAAVLDKLASTAERLGNAPVQLEFIRAELKLLPEKDRGVLKAKADAIAADLERKAANVSRQPLVRNTPDQDHMVRPRLIRSAQ